MTTAPTPSRTEELAQWLEQDWDAMGVPELLDVAKELRHLQASYQALQTENERLRMELVAEARAAAEQKLRADQLAQQHRMQAQMHAQATQQLAELEARKPLPLSDEQIDDLHGEANRGFDIGHEEYTKAFRDAERAHGITGGSS